jgi:hypothetical protein
VKLRSLAIGMFGSSNSKATTTENGISAAGPLAAHPRSMQALQQGLQQSRANASRFGRRAWSVLIRHN